MLYSAKPEADTYAHRSENLSKWFCITGEVFGDHMFDTLPVGQAECLKMIGGLEKSLLGDEHRMF